MMGQCISHYGIIKKLGAGGMGEVYCAEDSYLHRTWFGSQPMSQAV